eukprot:Polyplicarium_translucidae@DN5209_c0_g1_i1.p1
MDVSLRQERNALPSFSRSASVVYFRHKFESRFGGSEVPEEPPPGIHIRSIVEAGGVARRADLGLRELEKRIQDLDEEIQRLRERPSSSLTAATMTAPTESAAQGSSIPDDVQKWCEEAHLPAALSVVFPAEESAAANAFQNAENARLEGVEKLPFEYRRLVQRAKNSREKSLRGILSNKDVAKLSDLRRFLAKSESLEKETRDLLVHPPHSVPDEIAAPDPETPPRERPVPPDATRRNVMRLEQQIIGAGHVSAFDKEIDEFVQRQVVQLEQIPSERGGGADGFRTNLNCSIVAFDSQRRARQRADAEASSPSSSSPSSSSSSSFRSPPDEPCPYTPKFGGAETHAERLRRLLTDLGLDVSETNDYLSPEELLQALPPILRGEETSSAFLEAARSGEVGPQSLEMLPSIEAIVASSHRFQAGLALVDFIPMYSALI